MVDLHGYLGGSLLKSVGQNLDGGARRKMLEDLLLLPRMRNGGKWTRS